MAQIKEGLPQEKLGNPYGIANYSNFELNYKHGTGEIFGLLTPFEVRDAITGDEHNLSNESEEKSYTLTNMLMSEVWKNKEWFLVPKMAILPNAWDKIYTQPTVGDDVDATIVGTSISAANWTGFLNRIAYIIEFWVTQLNLYLTSSTSYSIDVILTCIMKALIINEYIFSYGSLLNRLGCSMASLYIQKDHKMFDTLFDLVWQYMPDGFTIEWESNGEIFTVNKSVTANVTNNITVRECIQRMRDNLDFEISAIYVSPTSKIYLNTTDATQIAAIKTTILPWDNNAWKLFDRNGALYDYSQPVDLVRLWAYQFICAEYYTDDQVDYIYNSQVYREYISDLCKKMLVANNKSLSDTYYTINGINIPYDWCSAFYFKEANNLSLYLVSSYIDEYCDYLTAIFNLNRSLKFKDYFTGGRTKPIATGDVIVNTTGNQFSVLDFAKKTQQTRFRMAIQRIGRKIDEVAKGLLGVEQAVDYHYPLWIGKTTDIIHATETENTGSDQYSKNIAVTSRLEGYSNQYGFKARIDRDCVLMGIAYYDVERFYFRGVERSFMHVDRFDHFNQFMQYAGDQPVYSEEYDAAMTGAASTYFAYKPAYEEFKEGINRADSAFVTSLEGFIFLDDVNEKAFFNKNQRMNAHVSPDFIRSKPTEMDRFYINITGYSLATYFHFISLYKNYNNATRPMAYNPGVNI